MEGLQGRCDLADVLATIDRVPRHGSRLTAHVTICGHNVIPGSRFVVPDKPRPRWHQLEGPLERHRRASAA